jgi:molybdopterin-guanine dinucleotide biosynthesis protein
MSRPFIVGIGGFESSVGKTTLLCELLREFPEWEAIKTTRGHYRSCGKDPHACCVSHLLADEPLVLSGKRETYAEGKDTGRYWVAGAANVHWLIVTDNQLERGINQILQRVKAPAVLIEGNSFTRFVKPDYFLMVKRRDSEKIKTTARQSLQFADAIYESDIASGRPLNHDRSLTRQRIGAPVYSRADYEALLVDLRDRFLLHNSLEISNLAHV